MERGFRGFPMPGAACVGYAALLAGAPTTSAIQLVLSSGTAESWVEGWHAQVAFALGFTVGLAVLGRASKRVDSLFASKGPLFACFVLTLAGAMLYATSVMGAVPLFLASTGAAIRGAGYAGLNVGWVELLASLMPHRRRVSLVLPLGLLIGSFLGVLIWLLSLSAGVMPGLIALAALPAISFALLAYSRTEVRREGIVAAPGRRLLSMPRATRWIIGAFGISLGCMWAVFYSLVHVDLPLWALAAFFVLSLFMAVGISTFMPRRELEFGFALRWSMLLTTAGFLLVPVLAERSEWAVAFLLAIAWAAQILLLAIMPVQIASKLPVNVLSVSGEGGVSFGIGAVLGSVATGIIFGLAGVGMLGYSIVTAIACLCLVSASLYFPARNADASVLGMKAPPESELYAQRLVRRCAEVAEKWGLTAREHEVMLQLVLGKARSQVARELNISEETVRTHCKHVYEKLDVHSLRELVMLVESGTRESSSIEV